MTCVVTQEVCKRATEIKPWGFNWIVHLARKWTPNTYFGVGVRIRPSTKDLQTGFEYESSGGTTNGAIEPRFPTELTGPKSTVKDGSITWTARAQSDASLAEQITTVDWEVDPALTFTEAAPVISGTEQVTYGQFESGVAGETYDAIVHVDTTLGNKYDGVLKIEIDS